MNLWHWLQKNDIIHFNFIPINECLLEIRSTKLQSSEIRYSSSSKHSDVPQTKSKLFSKVFLFTYQAIERFLQASSKIISIQFVVRRFSPNKPQQYHEHHVLGQLSRNVQLISMNLDREVDQPTYLIEIIIEVRFAKINRKIPVINHTKTNFDRISLPYDSS